MVPFVPERSVPSWPWGQGCVSLSCQCSLRQEGSRHSLPLAVGMPRDRCAYACVTWLSCADLSVVHFLKRWILWGVVGYRSEAKRRGNFRQGWRVLLKPFFSPPEFRSIEGEPSCLVGRDENVTMFLTKLVGDCGSRAGGQG